MNNRDNSVDVAKGIGILLMIIGHMDIPINIIIFIYSFHMPLFYILSGYLFKTDNYRIKDNILKKAKSLLIPYIFFGILYIIVDFVLFNQDYNIVLKHIKSLFLISVDGLAIESALWFLPSMFFLYLLVYSLEHINKLYIKVCSIVVLTLIGILIPSILSIRMPLALDTSFSAIGFFYIGKCFKRIKDKKHYKYIIISVFLFVVSLGWTVFKNEQLNMRESTYGIFPLTYLMAIAESIVVLYVSKLLSNNAKKTTSVLCFFGKNSIVFLCINHFVLKIVGMVVVKTMLVIGLYNELIQLILTLIISIIVMITVTIIVEKTPLCVLFGKKYEKPNLSKVGV